jgi:hypothetical protein
LRMADVRHDPPGVTDLDIDDPPDRPAADVT